MNAVLERNGARQILELARDILTPQKRWSQKPVHLGCECAISAIFKAMSLLSDPDEPSGARNLAMKAACEFLIEAICVPSITRWNDALGRTHEEILAGFDAAKELAGQPQASKVEN